MSRKQCVPALVLTWCVAGIAVTLAPAAYGESQPICAAPILHVGGSMPVDAQGLGLEAAAQVRLAARVEQIDDGEGSSSRILPTETSPSDEPTCGGVGYQVRLLEPLIARHRYSLVVDYTCDPPYVVPPFGSSGAMSVEFVAIEPVTLPDSLAAPTYGNLESNNYNGCATDVRSVTLSVDPVVVVAPSADPGVDFRQLLRSTLVVNGACSPAPVHVECPAHDGAQLEMHWLFRIPHSGVGVTGASSTVTIDCGAAVDVSGCDPPGATPATSPSPDVAPATDDPTDAGCAVSRRLGTSRTEFGTPACMLVFVLCAGALRLARGSRRPDPIRS